MTRTRKHASIRTLANQNAKDDAWGIPESPEFSLVQRLMNEFQSHATHEERSLSDYRERAKETSDPQIRFLLGLIVADEERHHELTMRMISKLKDELAWTRSAAISRRAGESEEKSKRLLASFVSFLDAERKAIKEYERLKKESQGQGRGVFALLYDTMMHDSYKHIAVLEFLRRKLAQSQQPARTCED